MPKFKEGTRIVEEKGEERKDKSQCQTLVVFVSSETYLPFPETTVGKVLSKT